MEKNTLLRIISATILLLSVLFMPFWLSIILCLGMMLYFHKFYEGVACFLLIDLLYGVQEARYFGIVFISTFSSIIALVIIEILKKKLKFYPK